MPAKGKYTDEEVRSILDRALRGEPDRGMSHDELVAIASEVGVSRESIDAAARQLQQEGKSEQGRQQILRRRRKYLVSHTFTFALVNAVLFAINYFTTPGEWWVLFPAVTWGLALIFHARFALSRDISAKALLKEQGRTAHELRDASTPRTRVDATPAASDSDAELDQQAELDVPTTDGNRRRE